MSTRPVKHISQAKPTMEGAGVKLHRAFGFGETEAFDPFLLFDDFRNDNPDDYMAGFPWHPHRGIETITYVLAGTVDHGDSLGNQGSLGAGDVQWMTAGSGILHQEMPKAIPNVIPTIPVTRFTLNERVAENGCCLFASTIAFIRQGTPTPKHKIQKSLQRF